jgi:hypothetical protein
MLVSHRHQFIYTKTMKTASTSVEVYFEPFCADVPQPGIDLRDDYVCADGIIGTRRAFYPAPGQWYHHMPAALIKQRLGDSIWNSYFKFCAMRNPFDKVIAMFYHARDHGWIRTDNTLPERDQFERWLPQAKLISDRETYTIDGKFCLDAIVRYEHLQPDMSEVCARIGVPWRPEALPRLKTSSRRPQATIAHMYSQKTADIVRRRYEFEFAQFGYSDDIRQYAAESA